MDNKKILLCIFWLTSLNNLVLALMTSTLFLAEFNTAAASNSEDSVKDDGGNYTGDDNDSNDGDDSDDDIDNDDDRNANGSKITISCPHFGCSRTAQTKKSTKSTTMQKAPKASDAESDQSVTEHMEELPYVTAGAMKAFKGTNIANDYLVATKTDDQQSKIKTATSKETTNEVDTKKNSEDTLKSTTEETIKDREDTAIQVRENGEAGGPKEVTVNSLLNEATINTDDIGKHGIDLTSPEDGFNNANLSQNENSSNNTSDYTENNNSNDVGNMDDFN